MRTTDYYNPLVRNRVNIDYGNSQNCVIQDRGSYYEITAYNIDAFDLGGRIWSIWDENCNDICGESYTHFKEKLLNTRISGRDLTFVVTKRSLGLTSYTGIFPIKQENKLNKKLLLL